MPAGDIADGTSSDTTRFIEEAAGGSEAERRSWRPCAEVRAPAVSIQTENQSSLSVLNKSVFAPD